ncbi:hypothetical protein [Actinoplanes sp. NPDC051851]|uniref:hypothetical protein n=1 Tax=Actinoplanes sp. NPDC051851 TaxID=3154753 RepID=UPI0034247913
MNDPLFPVRSAVIENTACDEDVQLAICRSPYKDSRYQLAQGENLSAKTIACLSVDPSPEVRETLAIQTTDPGTLALLVADASPRVRAGAAFNSLTTADQRRALARDSKSVVRGALVQTVTLDEEDLQLLVRDRAVEVRWWMACSLVTPPHIREILRSDPDPTVRLQAEGPAKHKWQVDPTDDLH